MGIVRKQINWDTTVLPVREMDYHIMEVDVVDGIIHINKIYTAGSMGEAELIQMAIKELDPVAKYYVKAEEKGIKE